MITLRKKIIGNALFTTLLCLGIGIAGLFGSFRLQQHMDETGARSVPALNAIYDLKVKQSEVKASLKALLNPDLLQWQRQTEYKRIREAFGESQSLIAYLEEFFRNSSKEKAWRNFVKSWVHWQSESEKGLEICSSIDKLAIESPIRLALDAEHFFGTYKVWTANVSATVLEQKVKNPEAAIEDLALGRWIASLAVENQDIRLAVERLKYQMTEALRSLGAIYDFIGIEEFELAKDVYTAEVLPSIDSIQIYIEDLKTPINNALKHYDSLLRHEQERIAPALADSEKIFDEIVTQTVAKVDHHLHSGRQVAKKAITTIALFGGLGICLSLLLGFVIGRSILRPVQLLAKGVERIIEGDLSQQVSITSQDEIGKLAASFNAMLSNLRRVTKRNEQKNWLATGMAGLDAQVNGDFTIAEIEQNIISHVAKYVNAIIGALFIKRGGDVFSLAADYAASYPDYSAVEFKAGEGLVGQAAEEKRSLVFTDVPENYFTIVSGINETIPRHIHVVPCIYDDEVVAVIELGFFSDLSEKQATFLKIAADKVAISVYLARSRSLLEESTANGSARAMFVETRSI